MLTATSRPATAATIALSFSGTVRGIVVVLGGGGGAVVGGSATAGAPGVDGAGVDAASTVGCSIAPALPVSARATSATRTAPAWARPAARAREETREVMGSGVIGPPRSSLKVRHLGPRGAALGGK